MYCKWFHFKPPLANDYKSVPGVDFNHDLWVKKLNKQRDRQTVSWLISHDSDKFVCTHKGTNSKSCELQMNAVSAWI